MMTRDEFVKALERLNDDTCYTGAVGHGENAYSVASFEPKRFADAFIEAYWDKRVVIPDRRENPVTPSLESERRARCRHCGETMVDITRPDDTEETWAPRCSCGGCTITRARR